MMTVSRSMFAVLAAVTLTLGALPADAQGQREEVALEWREPMASGSRLYLYNVNGGVTVEGGTGDQAEVIATKRWRRGDPERVRVEVRRVNGGRDVVVCAFWNENASCDENGYRSGRGNRRNQNNDVSVHYTVRLPRDVNLRSSTVNGGIRISDATGVVEAQTVNGSITASSVGGPVTAETVNGSIRVQMGAVGTEDLRYKTVNGSITIEVPSDFSGQLSLRTVNGSLQSDFPITIQGRFNPRRIDAQIGEGGRRLEAETVNGSIRLVRSN